MTHLITTALTPLTPAERLKYIRTKARLTRAYIEKKYGLPSATLKTWENGVTPLTDKGIARCIDVYRCEGIAVSKDWIINGLGLPPQISINIGEYFASSLQYPLRYKDKTSAVNDAESQYESDDTARMVQEARYFKESYKNTVILMITNDDMEPMYQIGDMVGGIFRYNDIDSAVKRDCIVRLKSGEDILRRVFKSTSGLAYNLACVNPSPTTIEPVLFSAEIECVAPVIWHRMPNN